MSMGFNSQAASCSAEREGFEPPVPRSTTVFKTAAIDHSAISPKLSYKSACFQKRCKGTTYFRICKRLGNFFSFKAFFHLKTTPHTL